MTINNKPLYLAGPALVFLSMLPACAGSRIVAPATLSPAPTHYAQRVVVADFEREPDILPANWTTFFGAMARSLREEFQAANMFTSVTQARDLGLEQVAEGTLYATTRLTDFTVVTKVSTGQRVNLMLCMLTLVPCFWHGQLPVANQTITTQLEVAVFDVSGMTPQQVIDPRSGARMMSFDTAGMTPLVRHEYDPMLKVKVGYEREPEDVIAFTRRVAKDVVIQILNHDVEHFASIPGQVAANKSGPR